MTVLTWIFRILIFAVLVLFAIQNTETISLRILPGHFWQAPQVIVLFVFFSIGVIFGALSLLGVIYRHKREIARLKKDASKDTPREVIRPVASEL